MSQVKIVAEDNKVFLKYCSIREQTLRTAKQQNYFFIFFLNMEGTFFFFKLL